MVYVQRPRAWNLQGLQQWMQSIVPSKDFLSFMFSLIFFSSIHPVKCKHFLGFSYSLCIYLRLDAYGKE